MDKGEDYQYLALPVDKGKDWPCLIHITCSLLAREKIILILSCLLLTREKTFIVLHYLFNIGKKTTVLVWHYLCAIDKGEWSIVCKMVNRLLSIDPNTSTNQKIQSSSLYREDKNLLEYENLIPIRVSTKWTFLTEGNIINCRHKNLWIFKSLKTCEF